MGSFKVGPGARSDRVGATRGGDVSVDRRPTLKTVAARAAVSRQTVSNALNAPELVRADTLERVLSVIAELGYRPHGAARQMRTNRSQVIGLRLEPTAAGVGAVLDRFLHGLTEQAQLRGYRVMLCTAADDGAEIAQYSELLDVLQLDAFALTSTHHDDPRTQWLTEHDVPFVTFGRSWHSAGQEPSAAECHDRPKVTNGTSCSVSHWVRGSSWCVEVSAKASSWRTSRSSLYWAISAPSSAAVQSITR